MSYYLMFLLMSTAPTVITGGTSVTYNGATVLYNGVPVIF